jgi:transcriptional regulator with XRE-family HTH domain
MKTIGQNIKHYRELKGMSQSELEVKSKMPRTAMMPSGTHLNGCERDVVLPEPCPILNIAKALGIDWFLLFDDMPVTGRILKLYEKCLQIDTERELKKIQEQKMTTTIGANIKKIREMVGIGEMNLTWLCFPDSHRWDVLAFETERELPSASDIMRMAEVLNCRWRDFFDYVDTSESVADLYGKCLIEECKKGKQEQDKMSQTKSEYSTIIDNIEKALNRSLFSPCHLYNGIHEMTGWKHYTGGSFREEDGCLIRIDKGGREDEIAKIVAAASKILGVNPLNFFHNVEMNESRVKLANELVRMQIMENYEHLKKEAEEKQNESIGCLQWRQGVIAGTIPLGGSQWPQEVINKIKVDVNAEIKKQKASDLIEKAHRFTFNCKCNPEKILNSMQEIHSDWTHDTEYLKYVDCRELMIGANGMIARGRYLLIKGLIKIKEFKDIMTANDNEIIKLAIETAREHHTSRECLKIFCVIATTKEVRKSLYEDLDCDYAEELFSGDDSLKTKNLRDLAWLIDFFTNNNPDYEGDPSDFEENYKNALIKDILGE